MNIKHRLSFVALSVIATLACQLACESPARAQSTAAPGSWGVNVHTKYHAAGLQAIGTQWVRLDLPWTGTEVQSKGHYDWTEADKMVAYYQGNGMHVMLIFVMANLNPLYESQAGDKDAVSKAIATWSAAAAKHFKGKGILWEIGNEPEVFPMNGYWSNPRTYAAMARLSAKLVKQADPDCKTAALAMGWMDRDFATAALKAGLLADGTIDYLSFHGYHRATIQPEAGLAEDIAWLRAQASSATASGAKVPEVIDTETGYALASTDAPKSKNGWRLAVANEDTQAAYLARHYLEEIYLGVPISIWYKDMFGENGYSLYYADEKNPQGLRPMGRAFRTLAALLPDSPDSLANRQFTVTSKLKVDSASVSPTPNLYVRSYLRSTPGHSELIVAVWNAVEAFDGKILQARNFSASQVTETWRSVTKSDEVGVPVEIDIDALQMSAIHSATLMSLPDGTNTGKVSVRAGPNSTGVALDVTAQPTPTIVRLSIDPLPGSPTDVRVSQ